MPVPGRIRGEDMRLYAMVLTVILGYFPLQQQQQQREGARLYSQAASLCFTIALCALTASCRLPCYSKARQICLFHLILGCALLLSLSVPSMLCWAPYFSCMRPFFHLLPRPFQLRVLQFFRSVYGAIERLVGLVSYVVGSLFQMLRNPFGFLLVQIKAIRRLAAIGVSRHAQSSSPAQANFNSQQVLEVRVQDNGTGRLVAVGAGRHAQSSSPAQANFKSELEVVELRVQEVTSTDASTSGVMILV
ncbi:hypothetical protein AAC387_Pa07g0342 [Persea americana]